MTLQDAIRQYENSHFEYGKLDCCLFVCNVIRDVTGKDYAAPWRDTYNSEFSALMLIKRHQNLVGILSAAFGKIRPIWSVKAGSPVLINTDCMEQDSIGAGVGIYDGNDIVAMTDKGLIRMPITTGRGCWNV